LGGGIGRSKKKTEQGLRKRREKGARKGGGEKATAKVSWAVEASRSNNKNAGLSKYLMFRIGRKRGSGLSGFGG